MNTPVATARANILKGAAVAFALIALILTGCSGQARSSSGQTLTIGSSTDIQTFDTAQLPGSQQAVYWKAVYDTVVSQDPDGTITPGVAESWSYNDDNTVLTLQIRPNMTFADGSPVDAGAIVQNLDRNREPSSAVAGGLSSVSGVSQAGDATVEITLSAPDPALLVFLANGSGAIGNPKAFDRDDFAYTPAGSGPYTLDESQTVRGSKYTFVKNPSNWNADAYPYETVVIKPLPDSTARLNALRSGQVDATSLDPSAVGQAESAGLHITTHELSWSGLIILDRGGEKVPALGDPRVRQAMNLAFDRDSMVDNLLHGFASSTDQIFIEGNQAHLSGDPEYGFDVARARELMAEAGYADGFDITMPSLPFPGLQDFDAVVQQSLQQIGITVTYESVPANSAIQRLIEGGYPVFFFRLESQTAWYDARTSLLPNANWNGMHFADPTLTSLLEEAQTATSDEAASATYQKVGEFVRDQAWDVPLWWNQLITATNDKVTVVEQAGFDDPFIQNYSPAS